jgi:hypothetical protein
MAFLWEWAGIEFPIAFIYPDNYDALQAMGMAVAGTPETVRRYIASTVEQTGINYFVCDIAFGSISLAAASHSVDLFAKDVMPHFR